MRIDVHIHQGHGADDSKLDRILELLEGFTEGMETMSQDISQLKASVAGARAGIDSAIVLIKGVSQMVKDAGVDPVELKAVTDDLDSEVASLAAAVAANPLPKP